MKINVTRIGYGLPRALFLLFFCSSLSCVLFLDGVHFWAKRGWEKDRGQGGHRSGWQLYGQNVLGVPRTPASRLDEDAQPFNVFDRPNLEEKVAMWEQFLRGTALRAENCFLLYHPEDSGTIAFRGYKVLRVVRR